MSLMKRQFVATNTVHRTVFVALLGSSVKTHLLPKFCVHKKLLLLIFFCKNIACFNFGLLRIGQVFYFSCKIVYQWVMRNCCFLNDGCLQQT